MIKKKILLIIMITLLVTILIPTFAVNATPATPEGEESNDAYIIFYGAILLVLPFVLLFELISGFFEMIWGIILLIWNFLVNSIDMIVELFQGIF